MKKDFLCLSDITPLEGWEIINRALDFKKGKRHSEILKNKNLGLLFSKPSTRTRVSFEVGINRLGGRAVYLTSSQMQISRGEDVKDTARTLSRYLDALIVRTYAHAWLVELAQYASIPVINALTDFSHPCQILADVMTAYEYFGEDTKKIKIAYVGDGNNVANSLLVGAGLFGLHLVVATPPGYEPNAMAYQKALELAKHTGGSVQIVNDPLEAVKEASIVYTDVWVSMGDTDGDTKIKFLQPYQVNERLLSYAAPDVKVFHCLPAKKGQEIEEDTFEKHAEEIFNQAENRMWAQMALMEMLFEQIG
jgi:ornithine carbamoyltransferase